MSLKSIMDMIEGTQVENFTKRVIKRKKAIFDQLAKM